MGPGVGFESALAVYYSFGLTLGTCTISSRWSAAGLVAVKLVRPSAIMHLTGFELPCGEDIRIDTEAISGAAVTADAVVSHVSISAGCTPPQGGVVDFTTARGETPPTAGYRGDLAVGEVDLFCLQKRDMAGIQEY